MSHDCSKPFMPKAALQLMIACILMLRKMVEEDRYCADIMGQVTSVQEALGAVGRALMRNPLRHCAAQAICSGVPEEAEAMCDELLDLIYKHSR